MALVDYLLFYYKFLVIFYYMVLPRHHALHCITLNTLYSIFKINLIMPDGAETHTNEFSQYTYNVNGLNPLVHIWVKLMSNWFIYS